MKTITKHFRSGALHEITMPGQVKSKQNHHSLPRLSCRPPNVRLVTMLLLLVVLLLFLVVVVLFLPFLVVVLLFLLFLVVLLLFLLSLVVVLLFLPFLVVLLLFLLFLVVLLLFLLFLVEVVLLLLNFLLLLAGAALTMRGGGIKKIVMFKTFSFRHTLVFSSYHVALYSQLRATRHFINARV